MQMIRDENKKYEKQINEYNSSNINLNTICKLKDKQIML